MVLKKKIDTKLIKFIRSESAFYLALAIYFINSIWIAATALYPMAFDEQFHVGIIKLYTSKLTPFWASNPPGDALYGAVARDPSYIYHYLMSFPYRLLDSFISSEYIKIFILRLTSIIIFGLAIYIFRKVLLNAKLSRPIVHASLLIFVLIPLVPLLAAQINYDNLIFLMVALVLLYTQKFARELQNNKTIDFKNFAVITMLCMFGSLVKYAFLPFVLGVVIYLGFIIFSFLRQTKNPKQTLLKSVYSVSTRARITLLVIFLILFGLFVERYVVNTIRYSTPTPECDQVLSIDQCLSYGPWRRNYLTKVAKDEGRLEKVYSNNPLRYFVTLWLSQSTYQLFFTIDGPKFDFRVGQPFRVLRNSSVVVMTLGLVLILYYNQYLRRKYHIKLFGLVTLTYAGALLTLNYMEFINLGYPFAIQGRYLIPILPIVISVMVAAFSRAIGPRHQNLKMYVFLAAFIVLVTQGGGAGTYILRSSKTWYWPGTFPTALDYKTKPILEIINLERNIIPVEKKIN